MQFYARSDNYVAWKRFLRMPPEPTITPQPIPIVGSKRFVCKWVVHIDPNPFKTLCCGIPTKTGSWCEDHRKRVFKPREK